MNQSTQGFLAAGIVALCLSSWAFADAVTDYKTLFGEEEAKVVTSKDSKDAADFAAKLLKAAKSVGDQKDFQVLLCDKAYIFGLQDPAGYQTAIDAMKLQIEADPDRKPQAQEKLLKAAQLRFAKSTGPERKLLGDEMVDLLVAGGDDRAAAKQPAEAVALYRKALTVAIATGSDRIRELMDKIKQTSAGQQDEARLADLKAKLKADPKNTTARTSLILAYLGEFDNPAEAVKLVTSDLDEKIRTYVPLSARAVNDLDEGVCLELANWYAELAEKATPAGKGVLLGRSKACCERYLALHTTQDAARLKGTMLLEKVAPGAAEVAAHPAGTGATARPATGSAKTIALDLGKGVTMRLALIPAGKFRMGSPESEQGRLPFEGPQHEVTISKPFYLGVYEVTQEQYEAVMGTNPAAHPGAHNPVDQVSWGDAAEFCKKLSDLTGKSVRLPTEAEWEYACRAGTQTRFSFGDNEEDLATYAWYKEDSREATHPVGQKTPNAWGLYDMHGNVWEWCSDRFAETYENAPQVDPQGPASGQNRVVRGGSWNMAAFASRSASRGGTSPDRNGINLGFRVAVEASSGRPAVPPKDRADRPTSVGKKLVVRFRNEDFMTLARIPAGKFIMGSPEGERDKPGSETPQHEVTITKSFYLGIYEVTQEQYEAVMGTNPSQVKAPQNPVEAVSWYEANAFCKKLSANTGVTVRLPTEAEWEHACRAGTKTRFSFGDDDGDLDAYGWYATNSEGKPHPVGQKKPNPFGLYDMHGNVQEWCSDWDADSYADAKDRDPTGPESGTRRILRGGSWHGDSWFSRSAFRGRDAPGGRSTNSGFRVVIEPGRGE